MGDRFVNIYWLYFTNISTIYSSKSKVQITPSPRAVSSCPLHTLTHTVTSQWQSPTCPPSRTWETFSSWGDWLRRPLWAVTTLPIHADPHLEILGGVILTDTDYLYLLWLLMQVNHFSRSSNTNVLRYQHIPHRSKTINMNIVLWWIRFIPL